MLRAVAERVKLALRIVGKHPRSRGLVRSLNNLRRELELARRHRHGVKTAKHYASERGLKLNIGCGPNPKQGWVNVDLFATADLTLDMREAIPLPDGCCETIYSEHFFEHLDYPGDARKFLSECFRLLESGGKFSGGVPDTAWPINAYSNDEHRYFDFVKKFHHPEWCRTRMDHINYHFRQTGEHLYAYDYETFEMILVEAGFVRVCRRNFDATLDGPGRETGTLYVDATKP
jgi:predicted SAM-dependent methyltransferase